MAASQSSRSWPQESALRVPARPDTAFSYSDRIVHAPDLGCKLLEDSRSNGRAVFVEVEPSIATGCCLGGISRAAAPNLASTSTTPQFQAPRSSTLMARGGIRPATPLVKPSRVPAPIAMEPSGIAYLVCTLSLTIMGYTTIIMSHDACRLYQGAKLSLIVGQNAPARPFLCAMPAHLDPIAFTTVSAQLHAAVAGLLLHQHWTSSSTSEIVSCIGHNALRLPCSELVAAVRAVWWPLRWLVVLLYSAHVAAEAFAGPFVVQFSCALPTEMATNAAEGRRIKMGCRMLQGYVCFAVGFSLFKALCLITLLMLCIEPVQITLDTTPTSVEGRDYRRCAGEKSDSAADLA